MTLKSDLVPTWFRLGSTTQVDLVPTPLGVGEPGTKSDPVKRNQVENRVSWNQVDSSKQNANDERVGDSTAGAVGHTRRKRFKRTWWSGVLVGSTLVFKRGRRDVVIDTRSLEETTTQRPGIWPPVNIGDRLLVCGPTIDDTAIAEVVAMSRGDQCAIRVTTGSCAAGPVQFLRIASPRPLASRRRSRKRDGSLLPAVRAVRGGGTP